MRCTYLFSKGGVFLQIPDKFSDKEHFDVMVSVKENVLAEIIQDKFEHLLDNYEEYDSDEEEVVGTPKADRRDDPEFNPYGKKDE